MHKITIYGISNCSSVKKTKQFFEYHQILYDFIDFKKQAPSIEKIEKWLEIFNVEQLINKKSTTWRNLDGNIKELIQENKNVTSILQENFTLIKRPVVEWPNEQVTVGFDERLYQQYLEI